MKTIKNRFRHFLNDNDGMTAKDFMLFVSTLVFFLFVSLALLVILISIISFVFFGAGISLEPMYIEVYIELLKTISPVLMTITGGVFSVNVAGKISDGISGRNNYKYKNESNDSNNDKRTSSRSNGIKI